MPNSEGAALPGRQHVEPEDLESVFQQQKNLEISRLRNDISRLREEKFHNTCETGRFIGCIAETVRTILASWVESNKAIGSIEEDWKPSISRDISNTFPFYMSPVMRNVRLFLTHAYISSNSKTFTFNCSEQLEDAFSAIKSVRKGETYQGSVRSLHMRLVWEAQSALQKAAIMSDGDIRSSVPLIMLFILGFPSLKVCRRRAPVTLKVEEALEVLFQYACTAEPVGGPQQLSLVFGYCMKKKQIFLMLYTAFAKFDWQMWKDALMGRMSAQKHWRSTRLFSKVEHLFEEAGSSHIWKGIQHISSQHLRLDYDLNYWEGWPPHMPQIAHFEMIKLSEFYHNQDTSYPTYEGLGPNLYTAYIGYLEAGLNKHFQDEQDCVTIFQRGEVSLREGKYEDALKLFGRCIADRGHKGALESALNFLLSKDSVVTKHEVMLRSKMEEWFKCLVCQGDENPTEEFEQVDLPFLAHCFSQLFEKTWTDDALQQKVLALFHTGKMEEPVRIDAIEAAESFIISEPTNSFNLHLHYYLAIAQQSHFEASKKFEHRYLSSKHWKSLAIEYAGQNAICLSSECSTFAISIAYLLEKGCFIGREEGRKESILSFFRMVDKWGAKRWENFFDRSFVKRANSLPSCEDNSEHSIYSNEAFGVGCRYKDAIEVYEAVAASNANDEYIKRRAYIKGRALNRWGVLYHIGAGEITMNQSAAAEKYEKAISFGSKEALCNMGVLKASNQVPCPDYSCFHACVEAQSSTGMNNLAVVYEFGMGISKNEFEAEKCYDLAIETDKNPIAMYNLMLLYIFGSPALRSQEKADCKLSELRSLGSQLAPLDFLAAQIERIASILENDSVHEVCQLWSDRFEEIDDSLGYVKIVCNIKHSGESTSADP